MVRTEIVEGLGVSESKLDTDLKQRSQIKALEERLREFENTCSAQKVQISDLQASLCESNRNIRDLENRNNQMENKNYPMKVALTVLGILLASSMMLLYYANRDLFTSYYITSKILLNALMTNSIFHKLLGMNQPALLISVNLIRALRFR